MNEMGEILGPRLLSVGDIAQIAGVGPSAVSNWRKRYRDFPLPSEETTGGDLFDAETVIDWLRRHGKNAEWPHEQWSEVAWNALDRLRGAVRNDALVLLSLQIAMVRVRAAHGLEPYDRLWNELTSGTKNPVAAWTAAVASIRDVDHTMGRALELPVEVQAADLLGTSRVIDRLPLKDVDWATFATRLLQLYQERVGARGIAATPESVAKLQVALLEPVEGSVYDPACGFATVLAEAWRQRSGRDLKLYGQEINGYAWNLAVLHASLLGAHAEIESGDTLRDDRFRSLAADRIAGDPPWGMRLSGADIPSPERWKHGVPRRSADWLWAQVVLEHLADHGRGVVTISPSALSRKNHERQIRADILESDVLDAVIELPPGLWWGTKLPAALLVFDRERANRSGQVLFIDARQLGQPRRGRPHDLAEEDIRRIAGTVATWRESRFSDEPRFAAAAPVHEIIGRDVDLSPKGYIRYSTRVTTIDGEPILARFERVRLRASQRGRTNPTTIERMVRLFEAVEPTDQGPYELVRIESVLQSGPRPGRRQETEGDSASIPFVPTSAVSGGARFLRKPPTARTSTRKRPRLVGRGDLLLMSRGIDPEEPVGCAIVDFDDEAAYSESLLRLRPDPTVVDPIYLLMFLTSRQGRNSLAAATTGNVIANLRAEALGEIGIPLPDLQVQQEIAKAVLAVMNGMEELLTLQHDLENTFDVFREGLVSGLQIPGTSGPYTE